MVNQLLTEMDGFHKDELVFVVGTTNFVESLDPALLRPGRFDRQIVVTRPDLRGRSEILKVHTKKVPLAGDVALPRVQAMPKAGVVDPVVAEVGTRRRGHHHDAEARGQCQ